MMSPDCDLEILEALARGELDGGRAAKVEAHVTTCDECRDELAWLRAERALMARRRAGEAPVSPAVWENVAARIAEPTIVRPEVEKPAVASLETARQTRRSLAARVVSAGAVLAAAAGLVFVAWPHGPSLPVAGIHHDGGAATARAHKKLSPEVALNNAEHEYQEALSVLEAQYKAKRGTLPPELAKRYDATLGKTRTRVMDARAAAGNDVDGRVLVLDGYEAYLRSLQTIVSDIR
jgi:hypothetical protein